MDIRKEEFLNVTEEQFEKDYIVKDITKMDYLLILGIGIIPFVIASIWHYLVF